MENPKENNSKITKIIIIALGIAVICGAGYMLFRQGIVKNIINTDTKNKPKKSDKNTEDKETVVVNWYNMGTGQEISKETVDVLLETKSFSANINQIYIKIFQYMGVSSAILTMINIYFKTWLLLIPSAILLGLAIYDREYKTLRDYVSKDREIKYSKIDFERWDKTLENEKNDKEVREEGKRILLALEKHDEILRKMITAYGIAGFLLNLAAWGGQAGPLVLIVNIAIIGLGVLETWTKIPSILIPKIRWEGIYIDEITEKQW